MAGAPGTGGDLRDDHRQGRHHGHPEQRNPERADPGRKAALAPTVELPPVEPIPVAETATTIRGACSPHELDGQLAVGTDGAGPVDAAPTPDGDPGAGEREPEALEPVVAVPATGAPGDEPDDEWGEKW